jgi:hypothetical protein
LVDAPRAAALADAAAQRARAAGDRPAEALARVALADYRTQFAADPAIDELDALARGAIPSLEQVEDHAGLVHCWRALRTVANFRGRNEDAGHAIEQALRHSRLAGLPPGDLPDPAVMLVVGPEPSDEALRALDGV